MNGHDQPIKSYASNDYKTPESVIKFVPSSLSGDLRWDDANHRLYVGSEGQYLVTGRVAIYGMKVNAQMTLLVQHNDGISDYRISRKSNENTNVITNYVPTHYTFLLNKDHYLTFKCNVTKSHDETCTISGSAINTMIEVTRIA